MKISVFGLGYVGTVTAACLADQGHTVIGVDTNSTKVDLINEGNTPVVEQEVGGMIAQTVQSGLLRATQDTHHAVLNSDLSIVCVGTPSESNGGLNLDYVARVSEQIGAALRTKVSHHTVVLRSTMLPGSMAEIVIPALEQFSGKVAGTDFGVCVNPEFLREGTAVFDFRNPPKTVIGESDPAAGDVLAALYAELDAPLIRVPIEVAEMVKYANNVWHALKVGFANEIGNVCKTLSIDSHMVMDVFCQDTKLNLSSYYLKPGFAFGGSCLPKDVRALNYKARSIDVATPILESILPSNQLQIDRAFQLIEQTQKKKVGVLGFSFKAGTDDLRESPVVDLIERMIGKGYEVVLYDRNVHTASLMGANKDFIHNKIPHLARLMVADAESLMRRAEVLVVGNKADEFCELVGSAREDQIVIDLVRIGQRVSDECYQGICW